jgi:hypothetical protein
MLVLRTVAAANVAAAQTKPQVHPRISGLQTFFAAVAMWGDFLDLVEVRACFRHGFSFRRSLA